MARVALSSAITAGLAAALLFGASTPLAKQLLRDTSPMLLAGLLYLGSGIGLSNIRERLAYLYDGAAALTLRTGAGGGVAASIVLPLRATIAGGA